MDTKPYKILLVDDERLVRFTIAAYLERAGFVVIQAASPEEAIVHVKREHLDAVLTDVMMGEIDGFGFRDMIRQFNNLVPVIFVTSMVNDYGNWLLDRISEDVRSYFVSKDMSRDLLLFRLRRIIESRRTEEEVGRIRQTFDTGLEMASVVQRSLLPPWTAVEGVYHYGVAWNPFEKVSGDLYEWIRIADDKVLIIVGDVSGHGIRSSLAMTAIQAFIKRYQEIGEQKASNVHRVAQEIHQFIAENFKDVVYMAGVVAFVDFAANRIRYVNAGLPEPKCVSGTDGAGLELNPTHRGGFPFGLVEGSQYGEDDVVDGSIPEDAVFFLSSDGVTDASLDPEGNDRVPQQTFDDVCSMVATACHADGTVVQAAAMVIEALDEMGYANAQDDRLLLAFGKAGHRKDRLVRSVKLVPESIDAAAECLGARASELSGDAEVSPKVQLLLDEFLMNVYRHGLANGDVRGACGVVMVATANDMLEVTIWDGGFEWCGLSNASPEDIQGRLDERNQAFAGGGRGMAIMHSIANGGVSHKRISTVNRTVFRIPMGDRKK